MPKILLFGAGLVAPPFVSYMLRRSENHVTIASRRLAKAQELAAGRTNTTAVECDVEDGERISALVADCDIVISLVPYIHHAIIIEAAVKHKKNFVSTSYVSPAMAEFDEPAKAAGITVLNEIGVDPGVDHLYAMRTIDEVHSKGGKVVLFESYCGGLPAPECSNNPLGYKFSWSPRGVLLAVRNTGVFKKDGEVITIPGNELLRKGPKPIFIYPAFATYGYPNRDSSFYDQRYGMPECQTVLRGSLRYQGNVELVQALADVGFLSLDPVPYLARDAPEITWRAVLAKMLGTSENIKEIKEAIIKKCNLSGADVERILQGFKWFGLFSDTRVERRGTVLDTLCATMEPLMAFKEDERDMVLLQHKFGIEWADGKKETRYSRLLEYGTPGGDAAMARLVGVPCGVATQLILDGKITKKGVLAPLTADLYEPLLDILEREEGVKCVDESYIDDE